MERSKQNRGPGAIRGDVRDRAREIVEAFRKTFSVSEVAEVLDVSKATVHRWEHGARPVRRLAQEIVGGAQEVRQRLDHNRAQKETSR